MKLELVCPAGTLPALRAAVDHGADAVYIGFRGATNARNFPGLNFSEKEAAAGIAHAHERGTRVFVALNVYPSPATWDAATAVIDTAARLGVDALILADPGLMHYATNRHPALRLHLSVQGSATNWRAIEFYRREFGVRRAVLAGKQVVVYKSGRSEAGQPAAVLRAAESERMNELRGASPVSQSVMLDLDPLDMGPLRVRVMMSDQTVHAHIRTEHGELGQGLLQQGQSLESSLRTTGLEMGMLRVTVDQQQGRSDNAWMFQQQHQDRQTASSGRRSTTGEEDRSARGETGDYTNERVSIFA